MAEKVIDKLKRLSRELADSVRSEIDLRYAIDDMSKEINLLKDCIECYVGDKEPINGREASVSFVKGYYEAKQKQNQKQLNLNFVSNKQD